MGNRTVVPALTTRTKKWVAVRMPYPEFHMTPRLSLPLKDDLQIASIRCEGSIELIAIDAMEGCSEVLRSTDLDLTPQKDQWDMYDQVAFQKGGVFVLRLTGEKEPPFTAGKSIMYEIKYF